MLRGSLLPQRDWAPCAAHFEVFVGKRLEGGSAKTSSVLGEEGSSKRKQQERLLRNEVASALSSVLRALAALARTRPHISSGPE